MRLTIMPIDLLTDSTRASLEKFFQLGFDQTNSQVNVRDLIFQSQEIFLVEYDDRVVGCLSWMPTFDSAYLSFLYIDQSFRGEGLGHYLVRSWLRNARVMRFRSAGLHCHTIKPLLYFYESCGFSTTCLIPNYYGVGIDAYEMNTKFIFEK